MSVQQFGSIPIEYNNINNSNKHECNLQQSIPSPPCSIPDQQISYSNQQMMIGIPSPNLFDNSNNVLPIQNHMTNNSEFNGNDAAATVAAAEHHMQQQQIMANIIQQQHNMPFLFNNNIIQNNIIDPKQFDEMSREELISRLITLEKEKIIENKTDIISEEDNILMLEQQQQIQVENVRTCLWADCGEKFTILQDLISHITEVHVGGGKPTYRCEWKNCARNNKPFTKRHKMYNHLRTHTGERPFACPKPDCDKKFSRPDSLTTHIKTHSNVRPFICMFNGCGKAYYHSRSLKKHEKIHETNSPIQSAETGLVPNPQQQFNVDSFYQQQFNNFTSFSSPLNNTTTTTAFDNSNFITNFLDSTTSIVQNL